MLKRFIVFTFLYSFLDKQLAYEKSIIAFMLKVKFY